MKVMCNQWDVGTCCQLAPKGALRLPDVGLHGNTHIAFADLNNEAVAEELSKWLHRKGLDKFAEE